MDRPVLFLALKRAMIGGRIISLAKIAFPLPPLLRIGIMAKIATTIIEPYVTYSPIPILSVRVCSFTE